MSDYKRRIIVDTMSMEEILQILSEDSRFLQHKIDENQKKYKRLAKDSMRKDRVYYDHLAYKSTAGFSQKRYGTITTLKR